MRPTILAFNLTDERLAKLRFLCMRLGCAVKHVPEADWGQPLFALCGLSAPGERIPTEGFEDEMLVFCHMDHAAVHRFLQTAKQMRFRPVALKAILTPTNAEWPPVRLHAELAAERAAVLQGETADHESRKEHPAMHELTIRPEDGLQAAIDRLPGDGEAAVIRLLPGVYREKVELRRAHTTLVGAGAEETRIVWADAATAPHPDGLNIGTFRSYTLLVLAEDCHLRGLTIQNAAAPREEVGQCVALFADGDGFTCEGCTLLSYQDTLFTAPLPPKEALKNGFLGPTQHLPRVPQRQTYRRCTIKGDVDFIFGGAAAWFEECDIVCVDGYEGRRAPGGYATAASTPEGQKYGYVFRHCRFIGENVPDASFFLGRPWRAFAKTVLLACEIGAHIKPEGWNDWGKADFSRTGLYAEYGCTGAGSDTSARAAFSRTLTAQEAADITYEDFLNSL